MTQIDEGAWHLLNPEVREASQAIVAALKYDDAIFAAFRLVEAKLQHGAQSNAIGQALIADAFDGPTPRVDIARDARDRDSIRQLFSGAFGHIRNDRGHKSAPSLPCPDAAVCFQYLSTASLLLHFLAQDRNLLPRIDGIRLFGTHERPFLEMRGERLDKVQAVFAGDLSITVLRQSESVIEVAPPARFHGVIHLKTTADQLLDVECNAFAFSQADSFYEVIATDIPLFSDAQCKVVRLNVVGMSVKAHEAGRQFVRIQPTEPGRYRVGQYVTHGPFREMQIVSETWYLDSVTAKPRSAWLSSMVSIPEVIGSAGKRRYSSIHIFPTDIRVGPSEKRALQVRAVFTDGGVKSDEDVTARVAWSTSDESTAFVKAGVLHAKNFGDAVVEAKWEGLISCSTVRCSSLLKRKPVTYFQGIRRLQQLSFTKSDSLYFVNQSEFVYKLTPDGKIAVAARLPMEDSEVSGIDCIHMQSEDVMLVNLVSAGHCFKLTKKGDFFQDPIPLAASVLGTKKSMASFTDGTLWIAVMGGQTGGKLVKIDPNGVETAFDTPDMPIYLASGPGNQLFVPSRNLNAVLVFNAHGEIVERIAFQESDSISGIYVDTAGTIYLTTFYNGKVLRLQRTESGYMEQCIASGLGNLGGIAADSNDRLFVSDFTGETIWMLP